VGTFKDITVRKEAEAALQDANRKLKELAELDGLTRVGNRRFFDEHMGAEWDRQKRSKKPLSLIICDVDFFKPYNDHYGHLQGDGCLCAIADEISRSIRRPADFVCRYGGEEFAVILPETEPEGAAHVAESIRSNIENLNIEHAGSTIADRVTVSLGVTGMVPVENFSHENLIQSADTALYASKDTGRNRVTMIACGNGC